MKFNIGIADSPHNNLTFKSKKQELFALFSINLCIHLPCSARAKKLSTIVEPADSNPQYELSISKCNIFKWTNQLNMYNVCIRLYKPAVEC